MALEPILAGPTGVSQSLPAYLSALLNGSAGGAKVSVNLWAFDLAVDPSMAFGPATLSGVGGSAYSDFTEIF